MIDKKKVSLSAFKEKTAGRLPSLDKVDVKGKALKAGEAIGGKAMEIKESAMAKKEDITEKLTELDRMLESSITQYNDAYTLMNDRGVQLFIERTRSVDMIGLVEVLVNSIANRPKSFDSEFDEIRTNRAVFLNACDFGERQLQAAREAAGGAGAGIAAGNALLAMAGPVGWTIAGATLLSSILIFSKKKAKLNRQKNEEIETIKKNTGRIQEVDVQIRELLHQTTEVCTGLRGSYTICMDLFGKNYIEFSEDQKKSLGALVNQTKALAALFEKTVS